MADVASMPKKRIQVVIRHRNDKATMPHTFQYHPLVLINKNKDTK